MNKPFSILSAAVIAASAFALHAQAAGDADKQSSTGQQGVPGVEVNVGNNASDRGLPGVEMNVGRDGDQKNIDTRNDTHSLGAGSDQGTSGDQKAMRPLRKDRG